MIITNSSGTFQGSKVNGQVTEFLGIQYATANRFCEPVDIKKYESVVDATNFGPQSPQVPGFMEEILKTKDLPTSEDCLYLNIWAPTNPSKLLPVLFWIHGGAYTNGTAATSWYNGTNLVQLGDVVLVSANYRLGPFGFIGEDNFGTLDQISALRWVNRNIKSFGGDPDNVTIFGESAGGSSVVALTSSPLTKGLISKAWAMSPSLRQLRTRAEAEEGKQKFLNAAKCTSVDELKSLTTQQIIDATAQMFVDVENYISTFTPTRGGSALPEDVYSASAKSQIPLIIGTNRDENRLWSVINPPETVVDEFVAKEYLAKALPYRSTEAWNIYTRLRGHDARPSRIYSFLICLRSRPKPTNQFSRITIQNRVQRFKVVYQQLRTRQSPIEIVSSMQTDQGFRAPAWQLCENRSNAAAPTWMYWFTWPTPIFDGVLGCCHGLDLPFMFNNLDKPNVDLFTGKNPNRQQISDNFTSELLNFAKTSLVSWPKYEISDRATLRIDQEVEVLYDPESEIRELWSLQQ
ncbi:MAG: carboxylesterase family protein [Actinobacteria bacterium]|nr:carboxylesterase family protein [Actinomycetota bacterium]